MKGTLRNIVPNKGYGFIIGADGEEYFLHRSEFNGHWEDLESDRAKSSDAIELEFRSEKTHKGHRAINASRLDFPNQ